MKRFLAVFIALSVTLFAFCACEDKSPDADAPDTDTPDNAGDGYAEDIDWGI